MLTQRLNRGIVKYSHASYSNPYFLVKKKSSNYRMVNAAQYINQVTIRDSNIPPIADNFSERFIGVKLVTVTNLFSGYDQVELHKESRDITSFYTPIGLLRITTLLQGATNSVA